MQASAFCSFAIQWMQDLPVQLSSLSFDFLSSDNEKAQLIEEYLDVTHQFTLNEQLRKAITSEYKGRFEIVDPTLGAVRADVVANKILIESFHVVRFDVFCDPAPGLATTGSFHAEYMASLARFIGTSIALEGGSQKEDSDANEKEPDTILGLLRYLAGHAPKRGSVPSYTQTHHVSICNLAEDEFSSFARHHSEYIRAMLLGQPELVSNSASLEFLKQRSWSPRPADFFEVFHHTGSTVSISKRFPTEVYDDHLDFFTSSEVSTSASGKAVFEDLIRSSGGRYNDYDILPEYPPLRYLTYPTAFMSSLIEELLRFSAEELIKIRRDNVRSIWFIPGIEAKINRMELAMTRVFNLDNLRLPIMRSFVDQMIAEKRLDGVRASITNLKSSNLNSTMLVLAIISVFLAILFGLTSFVVGLIALN